MGYGKREAPNPLINAPPSRMDGWFRPVLFCLYDLQLVGVPMVRAGVSDELSTTFYTTFHVHLDVQLVVDKPDFIQGVTEFRLHPAVDPEHFLVYFNHNVRCLFYPVGSSVLRGFFTLQIYVYNFLYKNFYTEKYIF